MTQPAVTVVLPAHNEAQLLESSLSEIVSGLSRRGEEFEVVVVENGSTDETLAIAGRAAGQDGRVRVVALPEADYGRAIARGFAEATAPVVVLFDVDYFDLAFLDNAARLLREGRVGIVLASKRAPGAEDRRPMLRRLLTAGFTSAMQRLLRLSVSDAHGMKAISRELCGPLVAESTMGGSLFDVELVLRASRAGIPIAELPARVEERRPPRTPLARRSVESAAGLVRLRRRIAREAHAQRGGS